MVVMKKENSNFKAIFGIYFKTNRKRLILTIIISIIVFTLLTTFLLTWFNYRNKCFYNSVELNDWRRDNNISIEYVSGLEEKIHVHSDYFNSAVNEIQSVTDKIAPEMFNKYTACMYSQMLSLQYEPLNQSYDATLLTLQQDAYESIVENLVEGRMPNNSTELICRPCNTTNPTYHLGDQVGLQMPSQTSSIQNFTIVGIIGNFSNSFYQKGYSNDIFKEISNYQIGYDQFDFDLFFTSPQNFVEIITFYPAEIIQELNFNVDFDYHFSIGSISSLKEIANMLNEIQSNYQTYQYLPPMANFFCSDLEDSIYSFLKDWNNQTVKVLSSGIPAILLFSFLFTEIFNIGNFEKGTQFRLLKLYGLEFKNIQKMILIENILTSSIGLFFGVILGTLFGYLFTLGIGNTNFGFYLNAFLEPVVFVAIIVLFVVLFISGFVIEVRYAKNTVQLTSEMYKSKRKKIIHRFFSSKETLLFILGLITGGIGYIVWIMVETSYYTSPVPYYNYSLFLTLEIISKFFIILGVLLILASILLILSKLVVLMWRFLGEWMWKRRKNYFTLALKQLSIYSKDFQKAILMMFIVCLCITPGFITTKSVNNHLKYEANLAVGCCDLLIHGWNGNNFQILGNISAIDDIELSTEVELITLRETRKGYTIRILNIFNVSHFVEISSDNFPNEIVDYSQDDIAQLNTNMSFLMDSRYARRERYDRGKIYTSSDITDPNEEPYNLTYINKFDVFPLLHQTSSNYFTSLLGENYNLVLSNLTASQLMKKLEGDSYDSEFYILANVSLMANKTAIIEEIESLSSTLSVETYEEKLHDLQLGVNEFRVAFFTVVMIIALFVLLFFGFLTAKNIYNQRVRIMESEYQAGAKRSQIWGNFSIEFLLIVFIPSLISMLIASILLHEVFGFLLEMPQTFKEFEPWLPVWLIGLTPLLCIVVAFCGWLFEMIKQVSRYQPVRQE